MAIAAKATLAGCLRQDKLIAFPANFAFILREPIAFAVGVSRKCIMEGRFFESKRYGLFRVSPEKNKKIFIDGSAKKIKKYFYPIY